MEYHSNGLDSSLLLTSSNISDPTNQQLTAYTGSVVKLKIMSLNCCSLRSQAKRARLAGLTIEHQPDIIRLEYIMLLKFPIILSSNSFIFYPLFLKLFLIKISLLP